MEVRVRVKGYLPQPDGNDAPITQDYKVDDRWGYIELDLPDGTSLRISSAMREHGIAGIEIMETDGRGLAIRPGVSNVIYVQGILRPHEVKRMEADELRGTVQESR